ncbi:MAG: penicillin-binding transpeptidase domain-containing protein, partial [Tuberibacillus sp.]
SVNWKPSMILPGLEEGQLVRVKTIPSERGEIVDRDGTGLAINGQVIQIGLFPKELEGHADTKSKLAQILHVPLSSIESALGASWVTPESFVPIKTVSALDTQVIDEAVALPGVLTQKETARVYPCGLACAHLIGYVGTITKEQLDKNKGKGYTASSIIGKKGLELLFEDQLRGTDGGEIYIADEEGNPLKTVVKKVAKNGHDIQLTIDTQVQQTIYGQIQKDTGTGVAINPVTGDVLGLVSTPSFDPNLFVLGISQTDYDQLMNNPEKPLLNRFTALFPPGSSIKPLVAGIALKTGALKTDTVMDISGKTWKKDNWKGDFHITRVDSLPKVNMRDALVHSDNIYFARAALAIGKEKFISGLQDFGFNKKLPFEYPVETSQVSNSGTIDSEAMLANSGYGQGQTQMSPLQVALSYTAFVNKGNIIKPRLIKNDSQPTYWLKNIISEDIAATISNDLSQVVESPEGTAYHPQISGVPPLAGKTGTAELKEKQGVKGKEYGWFVAYNTNNPSLEIAIMVENVQDKGGSHYVVSKVKNAFATLMK